jgi:hypothetical protein
MPPLPAHDLRGNLGTWAVAPGRVPAVARAMVAALPPESFDPDFRGQDLETTYFDTPGFALRKARRRDRHYVTLRLRCYRGPAGEAYALSAKTESDKFRQEVSPELAEVLLAQGFTSPALQLGGVLPGDILARLVALTDQEPLLPVVAVCARRYAVEDGRDRLTLDLDVATDTGKRLPTGVLEFKSTDPDAAPPGPLLPLGLRPIKLSKFLWAALWR